MPLLPLMLAAALPEQPLALHHVQDAKGTVERSWRMLARNQDERCGIEVTGDGRFFRITMFGLAPGEIGILQLANADIRPLRFRFRSDESGRFSKIYLPFLWHRDGGTVSLNASGDSCDVRLSFAWRKTGVKVH